MIKVIIERYVAEDLFEHYEKASKATLQLAMQASGFISGEALSNVYDANHRVVIATYRTLQDWHRWHASEARKDMMEQITPMLEHEEKITVWEH